MKAYYYALAKNEMDRKCRRTDLKNQHKDEADFYSAYVDTNDSYNKRISQRQGYKSLMQAIKKGKVDRVYINDFTDLNMTHWDVMYFMRRAYRHGAVIEIGTSFSTDVSNNDVWSVIYEYYTDYVTEKYGIAQITFQKAYIFYCMDTPFIYLEGSTKENFDARRYEESTLPDITKKYKNGFHIYLPEYDDWDYIDEVGVMALDNLFTIAYETLFDFL